MEGPYTLKRFFCHMATDPTPGFAGGTSCFERAGKTFADLGSVLLELVSTSRRQEMQSASRPFSEGHEPPNSPGPGNQMDGPIGSDREPCTDMFA